METLITIVLAIVLSAIVIGARTLTDKNDYKE